MFNDPITGVTRTINVPTKPILGLCVQMKTEKTPRVYTMYGNPGLRT